MSFTEHCVMLRTTRILIPFVITSLTILGLAVIYNGGCVNAQIGNGQSFQVVGAESVCE